MKKILTATVSAFALAALSTPANAQHEHMPGMTMSNPEAKEPAAKKIVAKKKGPAEKKAIAGERATKKPSAGHAGHTQSTGSSMEDMNVPMDHAQMDHSELGQMPMPHGEHAAHETSMTGSLGPYPMQRESSGTAWQPDTSEHSALHVMGSDWTLMAHGVLNFVYDHQSGRRGGDKFFPSGMLMGMARRRFGEGTLQFKAMVSPDPLMGKRGYPLLLASGETANGVDRLIDRQHPHDFFMELSASVSQNIGPKSSVFLYAGLPGEPAFGPPAFMHREAIMDSPEAPISHHWLDSTHITFGVVTGGIVLDQVKLEVSRFNAREPDQHRWNIETEPLDSTSVRVSWNLSRTLSLQGSWGHFEDPEQLEAGIDQRRWSASVLWADEIAPGWKLSSTLAWGRKSIKDHHGERLGDDAYVAEASLKHGCWSVFGRGEITENRELVEAEGEEHGPDFRVGKVSLGAVRDFRIAESLSLGAGALFAVNFVPNGLATAYGSHHPIGAMGFVRLKLN